MTNASRVINVAFVCLVACSVATATAEESLLWWKVAPTDSYLRPEGLNYDIFPEGREVPLRLVVENSSGVVPMRIGAGFYDAVGIALRHADSGSIGSTVSWKENLAVHSEASSGQSTPRGEILLEAGEGFTSELVLTPERVLEPGIYEVLVDMREAARHVRLPDGTPWTGRFVPNGSVRLHLQSRASAANRGRAHLLKANRALQARNAKDAILYYNRVLNETGPDFQAFVGLGRAYFSLGNYARSVEAFERAMPLRPAGRNLTHHELACAYVGLNDPASAARVLRLGTSESDVASAIAACETRVRSARSRQSARAARARSRKGARDAA